MPKILSLIAPKILDQVAKVFKLDKVLQYVEQPNDADKEIEKHKEQINMLAGEMSVLEDRLKKIEILNKKKKNG